MFGDGNRVQMHGVEFVCQNSWPWLYATDGRTLSQKLDRVLVYALTLALFGAAKLCLQAVLLQRLTESFESAPGSGRRDGAEDAAASSMPMADGEETQTDTEDEGDAVPAASPMDVVETGEGGNDAPAGSSDDVGCGDMNLDKSVAAAAETGHEEEEEEEEPTAAKEGMDEHQLLPCEGRTDDIGNVDGAPGSEASVPMKGVDEEQPASCEGQGEGEDDDSGALAMFVAGLDGAEGEGPGEVVSLAGNDGDAVSGVVTERKSDDEAAVEEMVVAPSVEAIDAAVTTSASAAPADPAPAHPAASAVDPAAATAAAAPAAAEAVPAVTSPFVFTPAVLQTSAAPASNSQDTYAYEEEQERLTMLKNLHQPMRKWFNQDGTMRQKYGNFPLFWQVRLFCSGGGAGGGG